jgi:ribosomal protein S18 acetylase RimI-like enzyme
MKKILICLLSVSITHSIFAMDPNIISSIINTWDTDDNPHKKDIDIINLPSSRWEEFKRLRLQAVTEAPTGIGVTRADEEKREDSRYKQLLEDAESGNNVWMVFASAANKLVGMAGALCDKPHLSTMRHVATIFSVYTAPEYRRKRVGHAMMEALFDKLEAAQISRAHLQVIETQENAITLYKSVGFKECGSYSGDIVVDGVYYDSVIMEKAIGETAPKNDLTRVKSEK